MNVRLVTNPESDDAFHGAAERHVAAGAQSPTSLERRLREDYPRASVVRGIDERDGERWYAYREGRWVNAAGSRPVGAADQSYRGAASRMTS